MNATERNKFDDLTVKVATIEERQLQHAETQKEIQHSQAEMSEKMDRIFFHLVGDKDTKTKGVIEHQQEYEVRLNRLERIYLALAFVVSTLFMFKDYLIDFFSKSQS